MVTQNRARENAAFNACPKKRAHVPQDSFLQNNKFLIEGATKAPRGGSCEGKDVSMWFPVSHRGSFRKEDIERQKIAVATCRLCPIRGECLMYSIEHEPIGIWGGFPETARALLGTYWKIHNKRSWNVKASFLRYRKVMDYIVHPEDIKFIKALAHDKNLAQPSFAQRSGLSATAQRRIRLGLADTTS